MKPVAILANLATIAVAIWGTLMFMDKVGPDVGSASGSGAGYRPPEDVKGAAMTDPAQMRAVLEQVEAKLRGGKVFSFRVAPERTDIIIRRAGSQSVIQFNRARELSFSAESDSSGFTPDGLLPAQVEPRAPSRILKLLAAKRPGTTVSDLDYMVLTGIAGAPEWVIFLKGRQPLQWRAPASGEANVKPLGT